MTGAEWLVFLCAFISALVLGWKLYGWYRG